MAKDVAIWTVNVIDYGESKYEEFHVMQLLDGWCDFENCMWRNSFFLEK